MRKARVEICGREGKGVEKKETYIRLGVILIFLKTGTNAPLVSGRAKNRENSFFLIFLLTYIYICGKMYLTYCILWRIL